MYDKVKMCEPERDDIYPITLPSDPPRVLLGREVPWGDVLAGRVDDRVKSRSSSQAS